MGFIIWLSYCKEFYGWVFVWMVHHGCAEKIKMTDAEEMLRDCSKRRAKLTEWEHGFIDSLLQMTDIGNMSHKQYAVLEEIWERVT